MENRDHKGRFVKGHSPRNLPTFRGRNIKCISCSQEFYVYPFQVDKRKFCSSKCVRRLDLHKRKVVSCSNCHEEFYVSPSRKDRKYCSRKCAFADGYGIRAEKKCVWCDNLFIAKGHVANWHTKTCSLFCRQHLNKSYSKKTRELYKKIIIKKQCDKCKENFEASKYQRNRKYCESCRKIVMSENKRGFNNKAFWRGGVSEINKTKRQREMATRKYFHFRNKILKRDKHTCQECGFTGELRKLCLDHIKPYAFYPELFYVESNARILCHPCHYKTNTFGIKVYTRYFKEKFLFKKGFCKSCDEFWYPEKEETHLAK